jgi:hypothetical protein
VYGEVVHKDGLPGFQGRDQDLPHVQLERLGSDRPSMLIEASIPSNVIEEISVMFFPQFLETFPRALSPLGTLV